MAVIALLSLALAAAPSPVTEHFQDDWQTCLIETSKLWASKSGPPDLIVDAATVYCRDKLDAYMIAEMDDEKKLGLNEAQATEMATFLAAILLRMNRGFAVGAVQKARAK
jgi:hypothetical protein